MYDKCYLILLDIGIVRYLWHRGLAGLMVFYKHEILSGFYFLFVEHYQNPLYVALTRTYKNLYLTHTDRLTPFMRGIPSSKYD